MVIHGQQAELGISAPIKTNSRLNTMARVVDMSDKQAISELGNHSSLAFLSAFRKRCAFCWFND
jgi:hypothetical protein